MLPILPSRRNAADVARRPQALISPAFRADGGLHAMGDAQASTFAQSLFRLINASSFLWIGADAALTYSPNQPMSCFSE
ncbi:hypothetical protein [Herbaspirillum huttiense]|uniref:hypothetical protein n=1 Tax=Herbaspirillum huttiense TaxID=863372 RepID=UPI002889D354|nr:hypothetical protein [Herbaspirillum huttiense]